MRRRAETAAKHAVFCGLQLALDFIIAADSKLKNLRGGGNLHFPFLRSQRGSGPRRDHVHEYESRNT